MTLAPVNIGHEHIGTEGLRGFALHDAALWTGAVVLVLSVGAAVLFVGTQHNDPEPLGAPPPAIMIELAPISVAPQVEDLAPEPARQSVEQVAPEPLPPMPQPDTITPIEPVEPVTEPMVEPAPVPLPDETAVAPLPPQEITAQEPQLVEALEPQLVEQPAPIETVQPVEQVEPVSEVIPDLLEFSTADVALPAPLPMPASIAEKRTAFAQKLEEQRKERRRREQQAQQAAAQQSASQSVEAEQSERVAAPQQTETAKRAPTISPEQWQSQVIAHINRRKRYPSAARSHHEEGTPILQFIINSAGQVLSARILRSSGFSSLDEAAIDMINRASPVPAPPASMTQNRITLTVPVNFDLQ